MAQTGRTLLQNYEGVYRQMGCVSFASWLVLASNVQERELQSKLLAALSRTDSSEKY